MATNFKARLKKMNTTWKKSEKQAQEMFTKVDAGVYLAQLQLMELVESNAGNLQIKRQHLITEGEFQGVTVYDNLQLEASELSMAFLRREIDAYGYECPDKAEDLEGTCEGIAEAAPEVKIRVSHSDDFTNVAVQELLSEPTTKETIGGYTLEEIRAMNRTALVEVTENSDLESVLEGIDPEELSLSELRDQISEALGLTDSESETLPKSETKPKPKSESETLPKKSGKQTKVSKKAKKEVEEEILDELFNFCIEQDITFNQDDSEDIVKEYINEYEYPFKDLSESQVDLLERADLTECIIQRD